MAHSLRHERDGEAALEPETSVDAAGAGAGPSGTLGTAEPLRSTANRALIAFELVVAFLGSVAVRAVLDRWRRGPIAVADEIGYLIHARVIAGGSPSDLSQATFYRPGSSIFMAPVAALGLRPENTYRGTLFVGAVVASLGVLILYGILRRVLPALSPHLLVLAAFLGMSIPAVVSYAQLATAEVYLTTTFLAWLWVLVRVVTGRRGAVGDYVWPIVLGLLAGLTWAEHSRGLVVLVATGVALLLTIARRRDRRIAGPLIGLVATAVGYELAQQFDAWAARTNYPTGRDSVGQGALGKVSSIDGLREMTERAGGILWASVVGSYGLVAIGLVATIGWWCAARLVPFGPRTAGARAERRTGWLQDPLRFASAAVVFCLVVAAFATAAAEVGGSKNAEYFFYQRYIDFATPLFVALAVIVLLVAGTRRALVQIVLAGAVTVLLLAPAWVYDKAAIEAANGNRVVVPGVSAIVGAGFVPGGRSARFEPGRATVITLIALGILLAAVVLTRLVRVRASRVLIVALISGAFAYSIVFVYANITLPTDYGYHRPGVSGGDIAAIRDDHHLAWVKGDTFWEFTYRFYDVEGNLLVIPATSAPPADIDQVIASPDWNSAGYGFRYVRTLPDRPGRNLYARVHS